MCVRGTTYLHHLEIGDRIREKRGENGGGEWQKSTFLTSLCASPQIAESSSPSSPVSLLPLSFVCLSGHLDV